MKGLHPDQRVKGTIENVKALTLGMSASAIAKGSEKLVVTAASMEGTAPRPCKRARATAPDEVSAHVPAVGSPRPSLDSAAAVCTGQFYAGVDGAGSLCPVVDAAAMCTDHFPDSDFSHFTPDEVSGVALQTDSRGHRGYEDDPALLAFLPEWGGAVDEEKEWSDEEVLVPGWLGLGGD